MASEKSIVQAAPSYRDDPVRSKATKSRRRKPQRIRQIHAALLFAPTAILGGIFIYGFIAFTARVSISAGYSPLNKDLAAADPLLSNYSGLLADSRFQMSLRNIVILTIAVLVLAVAIGLALALLVSNLGKSAGLFRAGFLLPYALSFVVTGVLWRWLFTPETGVNMLLKMSGISSLYEKMAGEPLQPDWITSPEIAGSVNGIIESIFPNAANFLQVSLGIPVALVPVIFAATWQLSGFAMAIFLAGMGGIPEEIYEAARVDGASKSRMFFNITLPLLKPFIVVAVVLLAHVVLKSFDLVYAMVGSGPGFATDVPAIFIYDQMFRALNYKNGAAASIILLLIVLAVMVPYLIRTYGRRRFQ